jgi:uncharacterized BrkB/YihY/UPF0761 family membrane protein
MHSLLAVTLDSTAALPLGLVCSLLATVAGFAWKISRGVTRIEDGLRNSWSQDHQREWSQVFANRNPELDVPDPDAIVQKQQRRTAGE